MISVGILFAIMFAVWLSFRIGILVGELEERERSEWEDPGHTETWPGSRDLGD